MFFRKRTTSKSTAGSAQSTAKAAHNPFEDETSLGNVLIKMRALTKEQLYTAIGRKAIHDDMLLGALLKELGFVDDLQVAKALTVQAEMRKGDVGEAALTMMEMRLEAFGQGETRISEAIEQRKAEHQRARARGECEDKSGTWIVPFSPTAKVH